MTTRYCTNCGAPLVEGNRFCGQCGQAVQPSAPPSPPRGDDFVRSAPPPPSRSDDFSRSASAPPSPPRSDDFSRSASAPPPPPRSDEFSRPASPPPPPPSRSSDFGRSVSPPPPPAPRSDDFSRSAPPAASRPSGEQILGIVALGKPKGLMGMRQDAYNMIVTPSRLVFAYVSPELMKQATKQAREEAKQQGKGFLGQWGAQLAWLDLLHRHYQALTMDDILARYAGSFVVQNHQVRKVRYRQVHDHESASSTDELVLQTNEGKLRFKLLRGNLRQVKQLLRQTLGNVA